jgi:predicted dehydrogenase
MKAATDLAEKKGLSILSGLQSRFHNGWQETVKRIHDGAIGDIVAMQSMFLRGPYRVYERPESMPETEYQFYNWYHFRWLSGDDVPQSLVHNVDRMSWIMKEATPDWAFGLGGRSSSFGVKFGDMFDHHTVVYEYPQGARLYALCRTQGNCYNNSSDIIMGSKGTCYLNFHHPRIEGENAWTFEANANNPYDAEQAALIESVRTGKPINSGHYMAHSTMITVLGQLACYGGVRRDFEEVNSCNLQLGPDPEDSTFETQPPSVPAEDGNYPLPLPGVAPPEFVAGKLA